MTAIPPEAVEAANRILDPKTPTSRMWFEDSLAVARALLQAKDALDEAESNRLLAVGRLRYEKARSEKAEAELARIVKFDLPMAQSEVNILRTKLADAFKSMLHCGYHGPEQPPCIACKPVKDAVEYIADRCGLVGAGGN